MASCPKCGRTKLRKDRKTNLRKCPRCGFLRGIANRNRLGIAEHEQGDSDDKFECK